MNRREFAESVMLAALVPALGAGAVSMGKAGWEPALAAAGDDIEALAEALGEVVRAQYGSRLTKSELTTIIRQIRNGLERAEAMRKVELANGDEPDFVFSAYRGDGR
jgi:hypothetical protein